MRITLDACERNAAILRGLEQHQSGGLDRAAVINRRADFFLKAFDGQSIDALDALSLGGGGLGANRGGIRLISLGNLDSVGISACCNGGAQFCRGFDGGHGVCPWECSGRLGQFSNQGFQRAHAMGQAVLDGVSSDADATAVAHCGHLLGSHAEVTGNLAHEDFSHRVDGLAHLGAAFLGSEIRSLVRRVATDDLVAGATGLLFVLDHSLDNDTDAACQAGLIDDDLACRRGDPVSGTGSNPTDVGNDPFPIPPGIDHLGQFVDAGCHATRTIDVEHDGLDLGVVQGALDVGRQDLGACCTADLGEQVGVPEDRAGDWYHRYAAAHGDSSGFVQPLAALGRQRHRIAHAVGDGQQVVQGVGHHQPRLRGSQLKCSRHDYSSLGLGSGGDSSPPLGSGCMLCSRR